LNLEIHSEPDDKLTPENYLLRIGTASAEWQSTKMQIDWSENCETRLQSFGGHYRMNIHLQSTRPGLFWLAIKILNKFNNNLCNSGPFARLKTLSAARLQRSNTCEI
jgi:hypothetical protein